MVALSQTDAHEQTATAFDADGPSPLPEIGGRESGPTDDVAIAERRIVAADANGEIADRVTSRLLLSDAWIAMGAISPALEATRQALTIAPEDHRVQERLAQLLVRSGAHRDAANVFADLARTGGPTAAWLSAARSFARAEAASELEQLVAEMLERFPDDLAVVRFAVEAARALPNNPLLPPRLAAAARLAESRGDAGYAQRCAVDAWVESRGALCGEAVVAAVAATGDARAAFAVAVDAATRLIASAAPVSSAAPLFALALRTAREIGSQPAEIAAQVCGAVLGAERASREHVRDLLAESGRIVTLSAQLRADARRESEIDQAAAAWKGVASVEMSEQPVRAAGALGESLARDPADPEARSLLEQLAHDPNAEGAVRDALFWATRSELAATHERRSLWMLLGDLERKAGDPASALMAYSRAWKAGESGALAVLEGVNADAEALFARAELAMRAVETASRETRSAAVEELLTTIVETPGAVRDLASANRVLGPLAGNDERVARAWLRITRRLGDENALLGALRRIATRSTARDQRARAAIELAEMLDAQADGQSQAIEVLQQLLDEQPTHAEGVAMLAAIAEHTTDLALSRSTLIALGRVENDALARDTYLRLGGEIPADDGPLRALFRALDEAPGLRERTDALREAIGILGDAPSLLARRTRSLLAQPSSSGDGLDALRAFVELVPYSPEATIAWFGAAGLASDAEAMSDAAIAVIHSLATARDAASVARAGVSRLFALGEPARAIRVAREAAEQIGLGDRSLRATVLEYVQQQREPAIVVELLEAAVAGSADSPGEQLATLRKIAAQHRARGEVHPESYALRRALVLAPADRESLTRLSEVLPSVGDERALSRVLSLRLASESDPAFRRDAFLTLAAVPAHGGDVPAAAITLDRYVDEQRDERRAFAQSEAVRALRALGAEDVAADRLVRWAEATSDNAQAAAKYEAAVRILRARRADPTRILGVIRAALIREPESPELLLQAEEVAREAKATGPMLEIYADLHEAAAGEHGRRALAYRRAAFLENVDESAEALEAFRALFEKMPGSGALRSAIERLALTTGRPEVMVEMLRHLADNAQTNDAKVGHYFDAAKIAREQVRDRRGALELALLGHDVKRDEQSANRAIEYAHAIEVADPAAYRHAVETIIDRTIEVADEVWDDQLKRDMSLRALVIAATEIDDVTRAKRAVDVHFKGAEDKDAARDAIEAIVTGANARDGVREAVLALPSMQRVAGERVEAPAPRDEKALTGVREQIHQLARSDRPAALAMARQALQRNEDPDLRSQTEELAREVGDAGAELELLDHRIDRTFDNRQRVPLVLRAADLLKGPLGRPADAQHRLENALATDRDNLDLLRGLHDIAEQLGAWQTVSTLLARRIERASDRAEIRALRLHRAAVLEQRIDDPAAARAELEAILEDEPAHRAALRYLADLYLREEQFRDAGECFARAAATTPVRSEAAELLAASGEAFAKGNDDVVADVQLRRALELDPRSQRALMAFSNVASRRGDWGSLERTLLALEENAETDADRVSLRMGAARAALEAGALHRAKSHLDSVRKIAPPEQVAALSAVLQDARDNDRPISRPNIRVVASPSSSPSVETSEIPAETESEDTNEHDGRTTEPDAPSNWLRESNVPRTIEPDDAENGTPDGGVAIPLISRRPTPLGVHSPSAPPAIVPTHSSDSALAAARLPTEEDPAFADTSDDELRDAVTRGDADAMSTLAVRLARHESGRDEAVRLERQRFNLHPSRLEALEAMIGLYASLQRRQPSRAIRSVYQVLANNAQETSPPPPLALAPEPPSDVAMRMLLPPELHPVAEIGAILWDGLANRYRREIASYGVTGVDRVALNGATEIARVYTASVSLLQLARHGLFIRAEVPGGAVAARTQPPSVILAAPVANDTPVGRFVLGAALEVSRASYLLAATLDPEERGHLVRAVSIAGSLVMSGASPASARIAQELIASLSPRSQKRLQDLLRTLDDAGMPFTEERWLYAMEIARARAGLLVSGDFGVAARMVVARHRGGGGEPDVRAALATLEPLRDLARFAVSEQYLALRWYDDAAYRSTR